MINKSKNYGFSLIEILIAVAIMAILVSVLAPNLLGVRMRARDGRRKSNLAEIQKAMELYKMDQNPQTYPNTGFLEFIPCNTCWSSEADCTGNIYMRKTPCDPADDSPYIYYLNTDDNLMYALSACLENQSDQDKDTDPVTECTDLSKESYTISEP